MVLTASTDVPYRSPSTSTISRKKPSLACLSIRSRSDSEHVSCFAGLREEGEGSLPENQNWTPSFSSSCGARDV
eukprot:760234-Hanusia_phi.AAC.7